MFELFFKYPEAVFSRGSFVLVGAMPKWLLIVAIVAAAAGLGWLVRRRSSGSPRVTGGRPVTVWILQTLLASLLLLMLWHPALSVATLRPQQNIVAVVVDDSASMAIADASSGGHVTNAARAGRRRAERGADSGSLEKRFQVRLYTV